MSAKISLEIFHKDNLLLYGALFFVWGISYLTIMSLITFCCAKKRQFRRILQNLFIKTLSLAEECIVASFQIVVTIGTETKLYLSERIDHMNKRRIIADSSIRR